MALPDRIGNKILTSNQLQKRLEFWRTFGDKIVFTNGCFDILHKGHIHLLQKCSEKGDRLVIGLNSDSSVKRFKGDTRPVNNQKERALLLAAIDFVDAVVVFNEDTPEKLIKLVKPDVLVKGADWPIENIVGRDVVEKNGGQVKNIKFEIEQSTSRIINKILETNK